MKPKVIATLLTQRQHGEIVQITREHASWSATGWKYTASSTKNFSFFIPIRYKETYVHLQDLLDWLRNWDPEIKEINHLGEYPLFEEKNFSIRPRITTKERPGHTNQILAKNVQKGSYLDSRAANFFRFWEGKKAVKNHLYTGV